MTALVRPVDVATAFLAAWNRHDARALAALFAEGADFVGMAGVWWRGRAEIEAGHVPCHTTVFRHSRLAGQIASVKRLSPGLAAVHVTWELSGQTASDGTAEAPCRGVLLLVVEDEGGWRIRVGQSTKAAPEAAGSTA
jgi:uncharacterized protein (TIGR02246 family)